MLKWTWNKLTKVSFPAGSNWRRVTICTRMAAVSAFLVWGCGLDTDGDKDGFFGAPEMEGLNTYDCDDTDPDVKSGERFYRDADGDGLGDRDRVCYICLSTTEPVPPSDFTATQDQAAACGEAGDAQVPYVHNSYDCDDGDKDERYGVYYYRDADEDEYGDPSLELAVYVCPQGPDDEPPTGYVSNHIDCDDSDEYVQGSSNGLAKTFFFDSDDDGFGGDIPFQTCEAPPERGYIEHTTVTPRDCDDGDKLIYPRAPFDCQDGDDNDCDNGLDGSDLEQVGLVEDTGVDEDANKDWYPDLDGDKFGDAESLPVKSCPPPTGYVDNALDCDDGDGNVFPGSEEPGGDCNDN